MQVDPVRKYFDSVASEYAKYRRDLAVEYPVVELRSNYTLQFFSQFIQPLEDSTSEASVVDIGCGPGLLLELLADAGFRVHGLDLSSQMVEEAKQGLLSKGFGPERATVEVIDALTWQPTQQYNGLAALGVLEYLSEDADFLRMANRALKLGGFMLVECRNRLFNLTSLNQYSLDEVESGEYKSLQRDYEDLLSDTTVLRQFSDLAGDLGDALELAFAGGRSADEPPLPHSEPSEERQKSFVSLSRRQHLPLKFITKAREHGFEAVYFRFLHLHPFPPIFEKQSPEVFRRIGLAMEAVGQTSAAATMSSSFLAGFEKRREIRG